MSKTIEFILKLNELRKSHSIHSVSMNSSLNQTALHHSIFMCRNSTLSHTGSLGSQFSDRISQSGYHFLKAAENIALCPANPNKVLEVWMQSPPHRQNLLNPSFTHLGIAFAPNVEGAGSDQFDHTVYWTALLACPLRYEDADATSLISEGDE